MSGETSSPLAKVEQHVFDPSLLFLSKYDESNVTTSRKYRNGLIILNRPFQADESFFTIWNAAEYKVCADGGANRLWDACHGKDQLIPSAVVGDFDSIRSTVKEAYKNLGAQVYEDDDQYRTDFGKSMGTLRDYFVQSAETQKDDVRNVLIISDLSGRVDQGIGILHEMLRETVKSESQRLRLWLVNGDSVSWILPPGKSVLRNLQALWPEIKATLSKSPLFTPNVGILPIYGPAKISTTGLEWDIKDWDTQMGGMVSTSNHVVQNDIIIETTSTVLFTIERNPHS